MSIYPVDFKNDKFWKKYLNDVEFIVVNEKCIECGLKMKESKELWAYHALPQGYGSESFWCSKKCCFGKDVMEHNL